MHQIVSSHLDFPPSVPLAFEVYVAGGSYSRCLNMSQISPPPNYFQQMSFNICLSFGF